MARGVCLAVTLLCLLVPVIAQAQSLGQEVEKLHTVLEGLYKDLIQECARMIDVSRAIAGFAAIFYIGYRVWRHMANAEPIDFFPLFRPFVLILLIGLFPSAVLGTLDGILKPTVTVTADLVTSSNEAVKKLLEEREKAIKGSKKWQVLVGESGTGDRKEWYKYKHPEKANQREGWWKSIGNDFRFAMERVEFNLKQYIKMWISQVLQVLYYAAALSIDTIRTFHLVVLAILGPLVFGISVFDGFQQSLTNWLARFMNIYLWLPVANLFGFILGKIQEKLLHIDLGQLASAGETFFTSTDVAYLIFMIIGILGYFTVPSVAGYIVQSSGNALLSKATSQAGSALGTAGKAAGAGVYYTYSYMMAKLDQIELLARGQSSTKANSSDTGDGGKDSYQRDKISGK